MNTQAEIIDAGGRELAAHRETASGGALTPMEMLSRAVEAGAQLETIERLMALQERYEDGQARKAFNEAFAAFKQEVIRVSRNKKVTDGPLKGKSYAELTSFVEAATPALSKHGLSASWDITKDDKDWIEVTCIIEHELGGSKRVSLGGPPDSGGAKNALQARISTVTYLERATFKAACGLAERGDDDDGQAAGQETPISDEQFAELRDLIDETGADVRRACAHLNINALAELPVSRFEAAKKSLLAKKAMAAANTEGGEA